MFRNRDEDTLSTAATQQRVLGLLHLQAASATNWAPFAVVRFARPDLTSRKFAQEVDVSEF
jgi:hypothetical protein